MDSHLFITFENLEYKTKVYQMEKRKVLKNNW